jgi:hypothetical protein
MAIEKEFNGKHIAFRFHETRCAATKKETLAETILRELEDLGRALLSEQELVAVTPACPFDVTLHEQNQYHKAISHFGSEYQASFEVMWEHEDYGFFERPDRTLAVTRRFPGNASSPNMIYFHASSVRNKDEFGSYIEIHAEREETTNACITFYLSKWNRGSVEISGDKNCEEMKNFMPWLDMKKIKNGKIDRKYFEEVVQKLRNIVFFGDLTPQRE